MRRVGLVTSMLAATPGIGGPVTEKFPLKNALAAAGQGLVLCGIAGEYGVRETDVLVQLLSAVLLHREVDPSRFSQGTGQILDEVAEPTNELRQVDSKLTIKTLARTLCRLGDTLSSLSQEFSASRQDARKRSLMRRIPGVGAGVDSFLTERASLESVAKVASAWLSAETNGVLNVISEQGNCHEYAENAACEVEAIQ